MTQMCTRCIKNKAVFQQQQVPYFWLMYSLGLFRISLNAEKAHRQITHREVAYNHK